MITMVRVCFQITIALYICEDSLILITMVMTNNDTAADDRDSEVKFVSAVSAGGSVKFLPAV